VNGEIMKKRSAMPAPQLFASSKLKQAHLKSKEEAPNYNATTDDALARSTGSGWPCKYQIWTKETIRNVSCALCTQDYSTATENPKRELAVCTFCTYGALMIDDGSNAAVHWKEVGSEKDQFKETLFTKANINENLGEQLGIRLQMQNTGRQSSK
jgi:hypothetical protein